MKNEKQAIIDTVKTLLFCSIGFFIGIWVVRNLDIESFYKVLGTVAAMILIYMIYQINLTRIRYEEKLKETVESFKNKE